MALGFSATSAPADRAPGTCPSATDRGGAGRVLAAPDEEPACGVTARCTRLRNELNDVLPEPTPALIWAPAAISPAAVEPVDDFTNTPLADVYPLGTRS